MNRTFALFTSPKRLKKFLIFLIYFILAFILRENPKEILATADMNQYCYSPPTISQTVPPLVMLVVGRDHKLYYEAYNDASDLDGDGKLDVGYKHSIDYYGYFDPYKCYVYLGSGADAKFVSTRKTTNKYCGGTNEWSGNFLNWLTMSRMDVLRKALYGGYRRADSESETVLEATYIPQDAHSWGKEYAGNDTRLLTPFSPPTSGNRHLFCTTSTSAGDTRKIRVALNDSHRIWEWASTERAVCSGPDTPPSWRNGPVGTRNDIQDYYVRVKVCDPSVGLESNCKRYPAGTYKPIGLLQKYGEYEGGGKWCSKSLKPCNSDSDCNVATDGLCVDKAKMYFGLLTGSYTKNLSGGVLRKNIWTIQDELNPNTGIFQSSENVPGNIILTLDRMTTIGFRYSDYDYRDSSGGSCGWITDHPLNEGECRMWGNPIAEMLYEAVRYFAGKGSPTTSFSYSGTQDSGLNLPKPDWGIQKGSNRYQPYGLFPICAKPFMVVLSDINVSYDSDSLPGSSFGGITGDLTGLNVSTLANTISSAEGISGWYFIGQSGSLYDFICSHKNVSGFSNIRGLCPEEPTKQGSYYTASISYYANTAFKNNFLGPNRPPNIKTYSVALASPVPDIAIKVGNNIVRIAPFAKSVSGCLGVYGNCAQKCTLTRDSTGRLIISNCQSGAFCPTNQIVDFYVEEVRYDSSNNLTYARFQINFEDVEQGADHDMDAIAKYEITPIGTNQIQVKVTSTYAAGCIDQVLGFFISGTTENGQWLVVRDVDSGSTDGDTPSVVSSMPLTWQRTFTVSESAARQLKSPLWYAAKWGGFDDQNGNHIPELSPEWDRNNDGNPDTFFYVVNPLALERELEKAFSDILRRASAGATVATLSQRVSTGALVLQPYFYPRYQAGEVELSWIGFLKVLWVDAKGRIREDTVVDKILKLLEDLWVQLVSTSSGTKIYAISNESTCTATERSSPEVVNPLFESGCKLAETQATERKVYVNINGSLESFNSTSLTGYLQAMWSEMAGKTINATCIVDYILGREDNPCSANSNTTNFVSRPRTTDISSLCPGMTGTKIWKLGDIYHSTPVVLSHEPLNNYHLRYGDTSYLNYITNDFYKNRTSYVFVGANDGMLHAFRVGWLRSYRPPNEPLRLTDAFNLSSTDLLGKEEWAFIPQNALPYLLWLGHKDYCHVPAVDYRVSVFDARVSGAWRTYLLGMMGFGGKEITANGITYSSSLFLLDLTDWLNGTSDKPTLKWEITLPDETLTLSYPQIVKLSNGIDWSKIYVVIGSGPIEVSGTGAPYTIRFVNQPKLYFIDLTNGSLVKTLTISDTNKAVGHIRSIDFDNDYVDDLIYFGTYNEVSGNLYRLSFKNADGTYKDVSSLSDSDVKQVFSSYLNKPLFATPQITLDPSKNLWVVFGTGQYLTRNFPQTNYFIGLKDTCYFGNCTINFSDLKNRTNYCTNTSNYNATLLYNSTETTCTCTETGCSSTPEGAFYKYTYSFTSSGWYHELTNNTQIYSSVYLLNYMVNALSFRPTEDICLAGGETYYWMVCLVEGCSCYNLRGEPTPVVSKFLAYGSPPIGQPFQPMKTEKGTTLFTQTSAGGILQAPNPLRPTLRGRFILWIEK